MPFSARPAMCGLPDHGESSEIGFAAFAELRGNGYMRYACGRLGDRARARACVDLALRWVRAHWRTVLTQPSPEREAWHALRAVVNEADPGAGQSGNRADRLHSLLPEGAADVALLQQLGLSARETAELMGVPAALVMVELLRIERLAAADGAKEEPPHNY